MKNKRKIATIYDIAKEAGVSVSTVSRVLGKSSYHVSDGLKNRVLEVAEKLNYRPNILARTLRNKKSNDIGVVVPSITNPFFPEVISGIQDCACRNNYNVLLCSTGRLGKNQEKDYIESLIAKRVCGIITASSELENKAVQRFFDEIKIVVIDNRSNVPGIPSINCNHFKALYLTTKHLIDLGHTRIAFVSTPLKRFNRREGFKGFKKAMKDAKIEIRDDLVKIARDEYEMVGGYEYFIGKKYGTELLNSANPPTAIVAVNDMVAIGVLNAAKQCGINVPDELSITGSDDIFMAKFLSPALTTAYMPKYQMGFVATEMIIASLSNANNKSMEQGDIILEPKILIRQSTVPPKK